MTLIFNATSNIVRPKQKNKTLIIPIKRMNMKIKYSEKRKLSCGCGK